MNKEKLQIVYELYDGRYLTEPERAICYEVCDSLKSAREESKEYGDDTVIVKTKIKPLGSGRYVPLSSTIIT